MDNKEPKISVLMPAYNAEKYIGEAIESILNQTFKDFEFIIIDDCSNDETWEIIQEYARKDGRIVAIRNEKNLGIAGNRNKLVSLAKGKYIVWQDADDISVPSRIEKQFCFMEQNSEVGMLGGYLQFFSDKKNIGVRTYPEKDKDIRKIIFFFSPVAQPVAMIRKEYLDEVGPYNLKYPPAEDIEMSFRIGEICKFGNIPEILLYYREHPVSATFTKLKKIELKTIEVRKKFSKSPHYKMTFMNKIYNFLQYLTLYFTPPKIRIAMFNFIRNSWVYENLKRF